MEDTIEITENTTHKSRTIKKILKTIFGFRKSIMISNIAIVMVTSELSTKEVRMLSTISDKSIISLHSVLYLK